MLSFDLRRLDIYRKVPKDLTQATLTGAIISITCCLCIVFLVLNELSSFLTVEIASQIYVDNPSTSSSDRIPVSVTIELPKLKCEFVGVDIQDDMGRHEVGFVDNTEKTELNSGEGCLFHSTFQINKVPGNFHISTHAAKKAPANADFTHKIHEVRFGDNIINKDVPGSFNPLKDIEKSVEQSELMGLESHDYIMKIVPTVFESKGQKKVSYQYTWAYRSFYGRGAAIWFRYDLSPLTVKYQEKAQPWYHFLTLLCAIVGGVFTVANMIDGLIFSTFEFYKKWEMGKLQ